MLEADLISLNKKKAMKVPSLDDLTGVYEDIVAKMEGLLAESDQLVEANEVLKTLVSEVRVWPDENARDGLAVEIQGDLPRYLSDKTQKSLSKEALMHLSQFSVVAGA